MAQSLILVVDPNPLTHRRVVEALAELRLEIVCVRDAPEALARAAASPVAVLLASVLLPRGNGYDLVRAVRAQHPAASCFLLAGGFDVYNGDRARDAGVAGRIGKPVNSEGLRAQIIGILGAEPAVASTAGPSTVEPAATPVSVEGPVDVAVEALDGAEPAEVAEDTTPYTAPTSSERIATFLPRDYAQIPLVRVDPTVVGPAMERAILEVLPEVVEVVLRRALHSSQTFRDLVETAVDDAVRAQLPAIAERLVAERVNELAARRADDVDAI